MATEFSSLWVRLRRDAGFKNAFDFYKKNGGSKVLKLSFISYWKMEQGKLLPKAERLEWLITCLRQAGAGQRHEIARAYLRTLLGSKQAYQWICEGIVAKAPGSEEGLTRRALKQYMKDQAYNLSVIQAEAIAQDFEGYWAHSALSSSNKAWAVPALAKSLGVKAAPLQRSLRRLAAHKLVKFLPDGSVRSPWVNRHLSWPDFKALKPATVDKMNRYHGQMEKKGKITHDYFLSFRSVESGIKNFYPYLDATVGGAGIYETLEPDPDAAMYLIRAKALRLFPLP